MFVIICLTLDSSNLFVVLLEGPLCNGVHHIMRPGSFSITYLFPHFCSLPKSAGLLKKERGYFVFFLSGLNYIKQMTNFWKLFLICNLTSLKQNMIGKTVFEYMRVWLRISIFMRAHRICIFQFLVLFKAFDNVSWWRHFLNLFKAFDVWQIYTFPISFCIHYVQ